MTTFSLAITAFVPESSNLKKHNQKSKSLCNLSYNDQEQVYEQK